MKCRAIYKGDSNYNLVFFRSKGVQLPYALELEAKTNLVKDIEKIRIVLNESKEGHIIVANVYDITYRFNFNKKESSLYLHFDNRQNSNELEFNLFILKDATSTGLKRILSYSKIIEPNYTFEETVPFKAFAISIPAPYNYAEEQEGVASSLTQRTSVLKGELWWQINYGLPLLDKVKNKNIYDSVLINIILKHPDVVNIFYLNSYVIDSQYYYEVKISSVYGDDVYLSNTISG